MLPVFITRAEDIYAGRVADQFKISYIQIPGKKSFSDAKKRITDVVTAQLRAQTPGAPALKPANIRLWLASDKDGLLTSFKEVSDSDQVMKGDESSATGKFTLSHGITFCDLG